jgi:hypothetical protein
MLAYYSPDVRKILQRVSARDHKFFERHPDARWRLRPATNVEKRGAIGARVTHVLAMRAPSTALIRFSLWLERPINPLLDSRLNAVVTAPDDEEFKVAWVALRAPRRCRS